jgi:hypothetical protein
MTTAVAAPDDPRPLYVLVLEDAIRRAIEELGSGGSRQLAQEILEEALER